MVSYKWSKLRCPNHFPYHSYNLCRCCADGQSLQHMLGGKTRYM